MSDSEIAELVKRYMEPSRVLCVDASEFIAFMERIGTEAGGDVLPVIRSMLRTPAGGKACLC